MLLPTVAGVISLILHASPPKFVGELGLLLCSLYASTNSFVIILFVVPYRNYSKEMLLKVLRVVLTKRQANPIVTHNNGSVQMFEAPSISVRSSMFSKVEQH